MELENTNFEEEIVVSSEGVVDSQEGTESVSDREDVSGEGSDAGQTSGDVIAPTEKPKQSREENSRYAAIRREAERHAQEVREQYERQSASILNNLKLLGIDANNLDDAADLLEAQAKDMTVDEVRSRRESARAEQEKLVRENPEYREMKRRLEEYQAAEHERIFKADLKAVKAAYPNVKANSIQDLGEKFAQFRSVGLDPVSAYEATLKLQKKEPPVIGKVRSGNASSQKFFTESQVDRMSPDEVEKNLDAIMESMSRW